MEKKPKSAHRLGVMDMMRRRRDPSGDLPFDPDAEAPMEEGEEES